MHRAPQAMVSRPEPANVSINQPRDPNTLSNYHNWRTKHTAVDFKIDFDNKTLSGIVKLDLESITDAETEEIVLDTRSAPHILIANRSRNANMTRVTWT